MQTMPADNPLLQLVLHALEERKAIDIRVLDVRNLSNIMDIMVIASGTSNRQVVAIAENVMEEAKLHGYRPIGTEGQDTGEWVLVDLGDVVVHVMQPHIRDFYQLERLWSGTHPLAA
jgi:ribosome-associated protein